MIEIFLALFGIVHCRFVPIVVEMPGGNETIAAYIMNKPVYSSTTDQTGCALTIVSRSASYKDSLAFAQGLKSVHCQNVRTCVFGAETPRTCLRYGQSCQFHQLVDRECASAHELLVEGGGIFGRQCLENICISLIDLVGNV